MYLLCRDRSIRETERITFNQHFSLSWRLLLIIIFHCMVQCVVGIHTDLGSVSYHLKRKTKQHLHRFRNHGNMTYIDYRAHVRNELTKWTKGDGYMLRSTSYAYVMEIEIGTPGQKLEFLIDTGSSNMAVAGPECRDQHGVKCLIERYYLPAKSMTSTPIKRPVETEYGKGSWSGEAYRDAVSFPGGPRIMAEFAVITQEKDFFLKNSVNEGILGLAYRSLSAANVEPLYDQLVKDKKVPNIFSMALCNGNGHIWFDEPEKGSYQHPIHWTQVLHQAWYTVRMTGIEVAGHSLGLPPYSYPPAIVDSGTTDILLEPEIYVAVISMLKKHGPPVDSRFWNNYCVETDPFKWPYITIYLKDSLGGSFALTLLGKHYVRKQDQFYCLSVGAKQFGAVLGEVVMEGNVVVFDRANHRVGFASSNFSDPETGAPCGNPTTVNTSVAGRLYDFCHAPFIPRASCSRNCNSCMHAGGAWCPNGNIFVWVNGLKSKLDASAGFCWTGGVFGLDSTRFQTFLEGHGSVEFELECFSVMPMYRQCIVRGEWLFVILILVMFGSSIFCMCMCCRRVYEAETRTSYPIHYSGYREMYPLHDPHRVRRYNPRGY